MSLGRTALTPALKHAKGSIFFLHGTCDTGPEFKAWLRKLLKHDFQFKDYKVLYPSAPKRRYDLMNGQNTSVWYNRLSPGPSMPEDEVSITETGKELSALVKEEQDQTGKVLVGGFSVGGSMALHLAYRMNPGIAGVFALSSFLPHDSSVFENIKKPEVVKDPTDLNQGETSSQKLPKLFMSVGRKDPLAKPRWTQGTFDKLRELGVEGHLYTFPNQSHEITKSQLHVLHSWIEETLTDAPKPKISETKQFHINDQYAVPAPANWSKQKHQR